MANDITGRQDAIRTLRRKAAFVALMGVVGLAMYHFDVWKSQAAPFVFALGTVFCACASLTLFQWAAELVNPDLPADRRVAFLFFRVTWALAFLLGVGGFAMCAFGIGQARAHPLAFLAASLLCIFFSARQIVYLAQLTKDDPR